jgi:predicted GIY-YIG superfamily endonuclease
MKERRDTYKYHVKVGRRVVYRGITNNLQRRGAEHKSRQPKSHIVQVGRRTTRERALEWERRGGRR